MKLYIIIFLVFTIFGCANKENNLLINNEKDCWKLVKINDYDITNVERPFSFLVFNEKNSYELFSDGKNSYDSLHSDNKINKEWYFDKSKKLFMNEFSNLEIIKLNKSSFVFKSSKTKYSFIKVNRPDNLISK